MYRAISHHIKIKKTQHKTTSQLFNVLKTNEDYKDEMFSSHSNHSR